MQARLIPTEMGQYTPADFTGKNESGITPIGDRIVIMPDTAAEQTSGLVFIDPKTVERMTYAAETGILVALGDDAFKWNSDRTRPFSGKRPQPGMRVFFERYAGALHHGADGKKYRLCDDKCLAGILEEPKAVKKRGRPSKATNGKHPPPSSSVVIATTQ